MPLLIPQDLQDHLHRSIPRAAAESAIRVAEGWLYFATRIDAWPDPVPPDLFSWAVELAAIAWSNPEGLESLAVGDVTRAWALARREEILAAASSRYAAAGGAGAPTFSFPPARPYPTTWEESRPVWAR